MFLSESKFTSVKSGYDVMICGPGNLAGGHSHLPSGGSIIAAQREKAIVYLQAIQVWKL